MPHALTAGFDRATSPLPLPALPGEDSAASAEVRRALAEMLSSELFHKAHRMSRLIRFLVERQLSGCAVTSEYAIGIEVFDRDPATYHTGEDPIVRVQVGRLRERLRTYYATRGAGATLRIAIPVGSYMPAITRLADHAAQVSAPRLLCVLPLQNFIQEAGAAPFTQGLDEELSYQLFKRFGHRIVAPVFSGRRGSGAGFRLEGSVRASGEWIRASVRLIDNGAGCIAWSEQFDRRAPLSIGLQEDLARAICAGLAPHLAQN